MINFLRSKHIAIVAHPSVEMRETIVQSIEQTSSAMPARPYFDCLEAESLESFQKVLFDTFKRRKRIAFVVVSAKFDTGINPIDRVAEMISIDIEKFLGRICIITQNPVEKQLVRIRPAAMSNSRNLALVETSIVRGTTDMELSEPTVFIYKSSLLSTHSIDPSEVNAAARLTEWLQVAISEALA